MTNEKRLLQYLQEEEHSNRIWWLVNFAVAQLAYWCAIAASLISAIAVSNDSFPKSVTSALAAIPGIVLAIDSTFKYSQRADWHSRNAQKLRELSRALQYQNLSEQEISQQLSALEDEMENSRPKMSFSK